MITTSLSTILDEINAYQALSRTEEQFKVRFLDEAIRGLRRQTQLPFNLKKGTLKVFDGVLTYPIPSDWDELAYQDSQKDEGFYPQRARYQYTSLQQFFEDPTNRNSLAEIFDAGTRYLGVRYKDMTVPSQLIDNDETQANFSLTGDATTATLDNVVYKEGNGSMRISITSSAGTATVVNTFTSFTDANYKKKYYFRWVYLDAVPTSLQLQLRVDASNYLYKTVTTQFSGQAFVADDWNLVAMDLNDATEQGTITTTSVWASEAIVFTGASTGEYRLDASYLREWDLQDSWYYSKYSVATVSATVPDQEYFFNSSGVYSTDSKLVADSEWTDVIKYDAMTMMAVDLKEQKLIDFFIAKRTEAWNLLAEKYPSMKPLIITNRWRFNNDLTNDIY